MVKNYLDKENPDAIVSVMPLINHSVLDESIRRNIPFIIVTNDFNTRNYLNGIYKPKYEKFKYILPFNDKKIKDAIRDAKLKDSQIEYLGFPIRPDFFERKNVLKIKKEFGLPINKPVIMMLMGAQGSRASYEFAKKIAKLK